MRPTIGRIVHYRLTDDDALRMNKRRADYTAAANSHPHPHEPGTPPPSGHIAHVGNALQGGDYYPAMVVRTFQDVAPDGKSAVASPYVNLQVFLDGTDQLWATSVGEGDGPGTWAWPLRVQEETTTVALGDTATPPPTCCADESSCPGQSPVV